MNVKDFLNTVCQEIKYKPVRDGIAEELKAHIQDIKEDYIDNGIEEKQAEEKAVLQMGNAEEIGKKLNKIHRPKLDWNLLILLTVLIGFGILVSILKQPLMNNNYVGKTILYVLVSIVIGIGIYLIDYKKIKKYSNVLYIIATIIMILPMISIGTLVNGVAHLKIFNIVIFTPTITVPLYLISFIGYISNYNKDNIFEIKILDSNVKINKDLSKIVMLSIISLLFMLEIPSIVNAVILGIDYLIIITIKMLQNKKENIKKLIIMYGGALIIGILAILSMILSPYRFERIFASFNPEIDPKGSGYVGTLQKEILDNAKMIGEADTKVISSDEYIISLDVNYTFIYLLGKTGILIAGILVLTIVLMSIKLMINAKKIKEQYGKLLIIGLGTLYILQSFASVLMNINMGIQTNVNVPFVTYGGVYFFVNTINMALILSVYRRKDIYQYEIENNAEITEN